MSEEEEKRLKKNEYHRRWYQLNLEKQRQRSKEKYHRLKHKWEANLSEEKKELRRIKNREYQRIFYEKKNGPKKPKAPKEKKVKKNIPVVKDVVTPIVEIKKPLILKTKKYTVSEIIQVLQKDRNHDLWNKIIADWKEKDWIEFENLKNK